MCTARRRPCDGGYVPACERCLKAVTTLVAYTTARQDCTDMQGHLVRAAASAQRDCVWAFVKTNGLGCTWVGADAMKEAGVFRWNDGTLLPDDSPLWASGQPAKANPSGDCVTIRPDESGLWGRPHTASCHKVCEQDVM
ncbi:hypothetical protein ACOMHN_040698 [Nucella lapillus]